MVEILAACAKCGAPLDKPSGAGRPRIYCSTACRRLAELAIRRLNRRLEHLEEIMSHARISLGGAYAESECERHGRLQRVSAEIELTKTRLRALLSEDAS